MFKKKSEVNQMFRLDMTKEELDNWIDNNLKWSLQDFGSSYLEMADLREMRKNQPLFYHYIKEIFYGRRTKLTDKPDAYIYKMKSANFLFRSGNKIPKKNRRFAKLGYTVSKILTPT